MSLTSENDRLYLKHAARLAVRGHGGAEPNPLVGCVIVNSTDEIVGWGYHRTFGGPHAEIVALKRAENRARGATLYCTLEPCNHMGQTGPCTEAIINAGIKRVVIARRDPHKLASGGIEKLQNAGIEVDVCEDCLEAMHVSDPFVHRIKTGLPWVTVKWAQSLDGKVATREGDGKWISNEASRQMVHRERGRVDAIVTGIGTVRDDDPMLTARNVRIRRVARRVVVDPNLCIPPTSKLVTTTGIVPTTVFSLQSSYDKYPDRLRYLQDQGVEVIGLENDSRELPLDALLRELGQRHNVTNVMVEAGPRLMSRLFNANLVNEAWVFIAPVAIENDGAESTVPSFDVEYLKNDNSLHETSSRARDGDVILRYRVQNQPVEV